MNHRLRVVDSIPGRFFMIRTGTPDSSFAPRALRAIPGMRSGMGLSGSGFRPARVARDSRCGNHGRRDWVPPGRDLLAQTPHCMRRPVSAPVGRCATALRRTRSHRLRPNALSRVARDSRCGNHGRRDWVPPGRDLLAQTPHCMRRPVSAPVGRCATALRRTRSHRLRPNALSRVARDSRCGNHGRRDSNPRPRV